MTSGNEGLQERIRFCLKKVDEHVEKVVRCRPNTLRLVNLIFGLFSLILSMNGFYRCSSLAIISASLCHLLDNRIVDVSPDAVEQVKSLVNLVSFGIAPSILSHSIKHCSFFMIVAFISFPYVLFYLTEKNSAK